jgi:hypothetical protein
MENLDKLSKRSQQYWYSDGFAEIVVGGLFVLLGAYFWLQYILEASSSLAGMLTTMFVILIVGSGFLGRWLIRTLKERITYPRTGYVAFRRPERSRLRSILIIALTISVAIAISALFAGEASLQRWIPGVSGLVIGLLWTYFGLKSELIRFYLVGIFSVLTGAATSWWGSDTGLGLTIIYGLVGLAMVISGTITLLRYLNASEADNDR